jgi:hypothetical protein
MGYLYRWTIAYTSRGPKGTPGPEIEYYYNVYTARRMSRKTYRRVEASLRGRSRRHARRYARKLSKRTGRDFAVKGKVLERTSLEAPVGSRVKERKVTSKAIRMKVKDGRAVPVDLYKPGKPAVEKKPTEDYRTFRKRITTKEVAFPKARKVKPRRGRK